MSRGGRIPPKELRDLFAQIPNVNCQGKCANSCGPIGCSALEKTLIEERAGKKLTTDDDNMCLMLKRGKCSVYAIRPIICRLWGVVPSMPCPHGCKPEQPMSDQEGYRIMAQAMELSGDTDGEAMRQLVESGDDVFWEKLKEHAAGARDLGGVVIQNRRPAAKALIDEAERMRGVLGGS